MRERNKEKYERHLIVRENINGEGRQDEDALSSIANLSLVHIISRKGMTGMLDNGNIEYQNESHRARHMEQLEYVYKKLNRHGTVGGKTPVSNMIRLSLAMSIGIFHANNR